MLTPTSAVRDCLTNLQRRRLELEAAARTAEAPAPRLHPNLAEIYRQKVSTLIEALGAEEASEARELVRGLVERITLYPEGKTQRVEIRGELAAILKLSQGARDVNQTQRSNSASELALQMKLVAGTRNRRSHHLTVSI